MSDDVLVKVDNLSKRFCRSLKRSLWYGLQDLGSEIGGRRHGGGSGLPQSSSVVQLRTDEFWAVKDVSFELRRGECLGLLGQNGAGKTTLLRMLNGLIKPDTGSIEIKGAVGALIALGAGFNPLLTGRENIYVTSSVLGRNRSDTKVLIDEIVSFSGIEEFLDTPVQYYSSGMQVRLGFAIATSIRPDVLFIDEVLAVGDYKFKGLCYARIKDIKEDCAIVIVSHSNADLARLCDNGIVMNHGLASPTFPIQIALTEYSEKVSDAAGKSSSGYHLPPIAGYEIRSITSTVDSRRMAAVNFELVIESQANITNARLRVLFVSTEGEVAGEWDAQMHNKSYLVTKGINCIRETIQAIRLSSGYYYTTIILSPGCGLGYYINTGYDARVRIDALPAGGAFYKI